MKSMYSLEYPVFSRHGRGCVVVPVVVDDVGFGVVVVVDTVVDVVLGVVVLVVVQ